MDDLTAGIGGGFAALSDTPDYITQLIAQHLPDCQNKLILLDQCRHCYQPTPAPYQPAAPRDPLSLLRKQFQGDRQASPPSYVQVASSPVASQRSVGYTSGALRSAQPRRHHATRPYTRTREARNDFPISAGPAGYEQYWGRTPESLRQWSQNQTIQSAQYSTQHSRSSRGPLSMPGTGHYAPEYGNAAFGQISGQPNFGAGPYPGHMSYNTSSSFSQQPTYINRLPRLPEETNNPLLGISNSNSNRNSNSNFDPDDLYAVIQENRRRERLPITAHLNDEGYVTIPPSTATQSQLSTSTKRSAARRKGLALHDPALPHRCVYADCGCTFAEPQALRHHYRNVHGGRDINCTHQGCKQSFLHNKDLERHLPTHDLTRSKNFFCPHHPCNKCYGRLDNLRRHIRDDHKLDSGMGPSPSMSRQTSQSSFYSQNQPL